MREGIDCLNHYKEHPCKGEVSLCTWIEPFDDGDRPLVTRKCAYLCEDCRIVAWAVEYCTTIETNDRYDSTSKPIQPEQLGRT